MDKNAKAKVPAIRFKGFEGEWIDKKLKDVSSRFKSGEFLKAECISETGKYPVYGGNGLRGYTSTYNHNGLYTLIGRQGALCGNTSISTGKAFFTEHAIAVQANIENDTLFVFYKLGLMDLGQYSAQSAQPGLSVSNLIELEASFPNLLEQKQISKYFEELDNKLKCHQNRLAKLDNLKKVMLQKMFPQGDATVPEVRFKGFSGEWTECHLSAIANIIGGGTPSTSIPTYWGGDIDWYSPTEIGDSIYADGSVKKITQEGYENSSAKMLPAHRTILFTSRAGIGDVAILRREGCTNQGFQSLILNDGVEPYFVYSMAYLIKDYALKYASGSTFLEISSKQLGNMPLLLPSEQEQQRIGNYFRGLDELISLERVQLDKLKQIKQACLAGMFV